MKKAHSWVVLPAIAGLLFAHTTTAQAATNNSPRATGGGWFQPTAVVDTPPADNPPPPSDPPPTLDPSALLPAAGTANTKCNFGFVASGTVQSDGTLGDPEGELSYHDHGIGLRLHSMDITSVTVSGSDASFAGTVEVTFGNNAPCVEAFVVKVHDADGTGGFDTFDINLPNYCVPGGSAHYHVCGTLDGTNGNGKIQTHN
jgi:hypothetical protein